MTDAVQVECYSGHTYAQEPRAVVWQGQRFEVDAVEARWRTPEGPAFRVRVQSEKVFELRYHEIENRWNLAKVSEPSSGLQTPGGSQRICETL